VAGREFVLHEANYRQLLAYRPKVAVLPWGATEAHNYHLPCGTDVIEATELATRAAELANGHGAKVIVLPSIPFGNNEQQLDQVATISFRTSTAAAILGDVARSLKAQGIDRLILLNAHGGNEFKPIVRDVQREYGTFVVVVNFFQMKPEMMKDVFEVADDHAGEMETSVIMHLRPNWVELSQAGEGRRLPFAIEGLTQAGVWTPRPWSKVHPDTGSGNPARASAEKGKRFFEAIAREIANVIVAVAKAEKGDVPYL
jgi:creatinine amidohydrolase